MVLIYIKKYSKKNNKKCFKNIILVTTEDSKALHTAQHKELGAANNRTFIKKKQTKNRMFIVTFSFEGLRGNCTNSPVKMIHPRAD